MLHWGSVEGMSQREFGTFKTGAAHRVVVSIPRLFTAPVGRTRACDTANSDPASLDISNCLCSVDGWMHGWMSAHLFKDL